MGRLRRTSEPHRAVRHIKHIAVPVKCREPAIDALPQRIRRGSFRKRYRVPSDLRRRAGSYIGTEYVRQHLCQNHPDASASKRLCGHLRTLAGMVAGIVASGTTSLPKLALRRPIGPNRSVPRSDLLSSQRIDDVSAIFRAVCAGAVQEALGGGSASFDRLRRLVGGTRVCDPDGLGSLQEASPTVGLTRQTGRKRFVFQIETLFSDQKAGASICTKATLRILSA